MQGNPHRLTDFVCLCPSCSSGRQCQFNTKSFSFTLDQLFSSDLLSARRETTFSLLLVFSLLGFIFALPNNLFSFVTLRRRSCLHQGVGHYLLWLSVVNQLTLAFLTARLLHLSVIISISRSSSPWIDDLFCKLLNYLLICSTRLSSWLPSLVALERLYTTVFFNKHWFKQPRVARSLILLVIGWILLSAAYELVFVKSFIGIENVNSAMCVIEYPSTGQSLWIFIHQLVSVCHFLFPLLINLCSTLTIMSIVIKNKMNIRLMKKGQFTFFKDSTADDLLILSLVTDNEAVRGDRRRVFRAVFNENREMITRPAMTLVPSIFSLFSLPLFIISFSLGCQNLEDNPLRYLLINFYFLTYIPQIFMFPLYVSPSSFYSKEWRSTSLSQRITALRKHRSFKDFTSLSLARKD